MPKLSASIPNPAEGIPAYVGLTPNQIVAYNLQRARAHRGWTQDQAREALAPFLGTKWSKANYSAAERSVDGERVRHFDADEMVAFARGFELPIVWFFMPPDPRAAQGMIIRLETPDGGAGGNAMGELIDLLYGDPEAATITVLALRNLLEGYGASNQLTETEQRVTELAWTHQAELVRLSFSTLSQGATRLHGLANYLEQLVSQAKLATQKELRIPKKHTRGT